ncbi:MAG TPA: ATP-dependent Clp protease ATP-binding subunit [Candidatus Alistipes merdigallinarum]|nr:ATP-dependent Clp protease ATP-binding subunit [Candidatus Alistipes merdigallinarum]
MRTKETKMLTAVFAAGCYEALRRHSDKVTLDHLFLAVLKQEGGHAAYILKKLLRDWEIEQIRIRIERELGPLQTDSDRSDILQTYRFDGTELLEKIRPFSTEKSGEYINTGHLLQAIVNNPALISTKVLALYNISPSIVSPFLDDMPPNEDYYEEMNSLAAKNEHPEPDDASHPERLMSGVMRIAITDGKQKKEELLSRFGTDLTRAAAEGELDPIIGRDAEIERVIQILGRRKKNNPVLIGEAGVGKSAIVEGLALRIIQKKVPYTLLHKRIFSLDVSLLVAGTKFRGEFEERINTIIKELKGSDIILFIDEIHTIVGAGSTQGSLDTANILKPALARGELQCIGATTLNEYREAIEADSALERRFQKVLVEQPSDEETLRILSNIKDRYEAHHCVLYTEEALRACIDLTRRYLSDRFFPDKAIDVMDEAGSRAQLLSGSTPESLTDLEREATQAAHDKNRAIKMQHYEVAATLRNRETALRNRLEELEAQWKNRLAESPTEIDEEAIRRVIASMTGIPVARLAEDEQTRLLDMDKRLSTTVIGQGNAVRKISRAILRSRAGLKESDRPIGVFLFIGPTGVGKTHVAKQLAKHLFGSEEEMIRIDMSEYSEKYNISRLIGAPPGYVGYGEGGQLTEKVRRHPYSVLLFDEIEKAHPDVFNLMLQLFDEGRLTDGLGRRIDFRNTIIIMTSNVGSREAMQHPRSVGYNTEYKAAGKQGHNESFYRKGLERTFPPEFINRIDDIVTFTPLAERHIFRIIDLEIKGLNRRGALMNCTIEMSDAAKRHLIRKGYDTHYGVRSMKRALLDWIEDPLAERIIRGEIHPNDKIIIECRKGELHFTVVPSEQKSEIAS